MKFHSKNYLSNIFGLVLGATCFLFAKTVLAVNIGIDYATVTGLGTRNIQDSISAVVSISLGLLGIVAFVLVIFGGYKYMTALGNDEKIKEAKKLMTYAVLGIVIIFVAFAIAQFVLSSIMKAT